MYLFMTVLGTHCCALAFSSCGKWGLLSGCGLRASQGCGFSCCGAWTLEHRLSHCGTRAQLLHSMWDLPAPGIEPVSSTLAGRFLTTGLPGKPLKFILNEVSFIYFHTAEKDQGPYHSCNLSQFCLLFTLLLFLLLQFIHCMIFNIYFSSLQHNVCNVMPPFSQLISTVSFFNHDFCF